MQMLLATSLCRTFDLQIEELPQEHWGRNGTSSRRISTILHGLEPESIQYTQLIHWVLFYMASLVRALMLALLYKMLALIINYSKVTQARDATFDVEVANISRRLDKTPKQLEIGLQVEMASCSGTATLGRHINCHYYCFYY